MIRFASVVLVLVVGLVFPVLALADEVSPWFGGEGQVPFHVAADGVVSLEAGHAKEKAPARMAEACAIEGCSTADGSAKVLNAGMVSP